MLGLWYASVQAIDMQHTRVDAENNRYLIDLDITMQAPVDRVYKILADYSNYHQLNDSFIESALLERSDATHSKTRLVTESCVLVFCFNAVFVYFVETAEGTEITARIDPVVSDFSYGESRMRFYKIDSNRTEIHFFTELQPAFWIPPFIGPWVLKGRILDEVRETFERVEAFAQQD
ncbi:MAG: hypothetical protein A2W28_00255 [Gammaproteobacteria bacterium RBG_16_51_14]|nr:MAG: hypothetical protein A2W28_00255 [Gammaproteobacteria bacterium RBG_16_51_14]